MSKIPLSGFIPRLWFVWLVTNRTDGHFALLLWNSLRLLTHGVGRHEVWTSSPLRRSGFRHRDHEGVPSGTGSLL